MSRNDLLLHHRQGRSSLPGPMQGISGRWKLTHGCNHRVRRQYTGHRSGCSCRSPGKNTIVDPSIRRHPCSRSSQPGCNKELLNCTLKSCSLNTHQGICRLQASSRTVHIYQCRCIQSSMLLLQSHRGLCRHRLSAVHPRRPPSRLHRADQDRRRADRARVRRHPRLRLCGVRGRDRNRRLQRRRAHLFGRRKHPDERRRHRPDQTIYRRPSTDRRPQPRSSCRSYRSEPHFDCPLVLDPS